MRRPSSVRMSFQFAKHLEASAVPVFVVKTLPGRSDSGRFAVGYTFNSSLAVSIAESVTFSSLNSLAISSILAF